MSFDVKFILHSKKNEKNLSGFLKLFDEIIKINSNDNIFIFHIPKDKFDKFLSNFSSNKIYFIQ